MSEPGETDGCRFQREGEYWTIAYLGPVCRLRDTKGLRYLARLLAEPGTSIPVADLAATASSPGDGPSDEGGGESAASTRTRERIRLAVCRCIQSALERVMAADPALGSHLEATIRRGYVCSYRPDPRVPIHWET